MLIAVAALAALIPASAQAALSLTGSHAEPSPLDAGQHNNFNVHVALPGTDNVKDLTISLPPGEVGNPLATPLCSPSQLPNCPSNTAVGTVASSVTIDGLITQSLNGTVYNLVPQPGEPARFGIVLNALPVSLPPPLGGLLLPPTVVQSGASLRQSDFGLDTVVNNIPQTADLIGGLTVPVHINSMDLTLLGHASNGNAFMRSPTSCTDHVVGFAADSWSSTTAPPVQSHFTPTNCGALDFSPAFSAEIGGAGATSVGNPTTAVTAIDQDNDEAGLLQAHVFVPQDLAPNVNLLGFRCSIVDFQAGACPNTSLVGNAIATSPLLSSPLAGPVLLLDSGGLFPNIGLDLRGQLHLQLQGSLAADKSVTFGAIPPGLPDIPIAHFQLAFTNPPGLLQANRDLCAPPPPLFHAEFLGYNGKSTAVDSPAIVDGCGAGNKAGACNKKKAKKHHKKKRAAEAKKHKKHKKKQSCKKKKKKHKKHRK